MKKIINNIYKWLKLFKPIYEGRTYKLKSMSQLRNEFPNYPKIANNYRIESCSEMFLGKMQRIGRKESYRMFRINETYSTFHKKLIDFNYKSKPAEEVLMRWK